MEDRKAPTPSQIEAVLTKYLTEADAAERLGFASRQAFNKRTEQYKRSFGRIKSPHGWLYSIEGIDRYLQAEGRPLPEVNQAATPFRA